ncbi:MAG: hypothetical protein QOH00_1388 [Gaiellales bacterium]|nr:hypothetical protein [Gaiellales bacterium]
MPARRTAVVFALAAAIVALVATPGASAAVWQGPSPLSAAGVATGRAAQISLGPSGDAAATWFEEGGGGKTLLVRKRAGAQWSPPVSLGSSTFNTKLTAVDAAGNVTAAGTGDGGATVSTWMAGDAAPSTTAFGSAADGLLVRSLAVNAAGAAVLGATAHVSGGSFDVVVGYRAGPTAAFTLRRFTPPAATFYNDPSVAINSAGAAVVAFTTSTGPQTNQALAALRTAGTDWTAITPVATRTNVDSLTAPSGIDSAGNALVAYTYSPSLGDVRLVVSHFRPFFADWVESPDLSTAVPGQALAPALAVNASGQAIVGWWSRPALPAQDFIYTRLGSTEGMFGPPEQVSGPGPDNPIIAFGDDGRAIVGWQITGPTGNTAEARIRETNGLWSAIRDLSPPATSTDSPSVAVDGHGHFAAVHTQIEAGINRTMVSSFDTIDPTVSPITLSGSALAGDPLTLAVAATDVWSVLSATWVFGDGGTASGASVVHSYGAAGTYAASVAVSDAAGNAVARQISITIAAQQSTLTTARLSAKWKQSRVKGTLTVTGTVPRAGDYALDATKGNTRKIHASFNLPAGAFSKTIKLPAKLVPGSYHVALTPPYPATQVKPAGRDVKLIAPAEGVVDAVAMSGKFNGPATATLRNLSTVWASFRFVAVPKGKLMVTWYLTTKGKRQRLGSATKRPGVKVASFIQLGGRRGKVTAVISRKGVVIAQGSVKVV